MNNTIKLVFSTFILALFIFSCKNNSVENKEIENNRNEIVAKIDSIAQAFLDNGKTVGFSIAVLQNNEPIYAKGFGYSDLENKTPVTEKTAFAMASATKLHTAAAVMILVDEGKLSLDNTIFEMMPDFPKPEQAKKIKIRHLLSHTSGLKEYMYHIDSLFIHENVEITKQTYFDFFASNELEFEPGTHYAYSNSGFNLMSFIIEKASGIAYEDFIEQKIGKQLGMTSLRHLNRVEKNNRSRRYALADSTFVLSEMDTTHYFRGDGGLCASAMDLAKLPFGLVEGKIISPASFNEMRKTSAFPDGNKSGYGFGMRTGEFEGLEVWGHTGAHHTYWTTLAYYPAHQTSIVVFNNTDYSPDDALFIEGEVALAVFGLERPDFKNNEPKNEDLSKYVGEYASIRNSDNPDKHLAIRQFPDDPYLYRNRKTRDNKGDKLYYLGNHTFASEQFPMDRFIFNVDEAGNVIGLRDNYNGLFTVLRIKVD